MDRGRIGIIRSGLALIRLPLGSGIRWRRLFGSLLLLFVLSVWWLRLLMDGLCLLSGVLPIVCPLLLFPGLLLQ